MAWVDCPFGFDDSRGCHFNFHLELGLIEKTGVKGGSMERQYYFDEDFAGAEYRTVIDLVGRKAHFVGLVFSVGIGREERLAIEGKVSELDGIVIEPKFVSWALF